MKLKYVTAFPGRRDSYQIPLSLFENGRLDRFVTDAYDAGITAGVLKKYGAKDLARRKCVDLPDALVDARLRYEIAGRLLSRVMQPSRSAVIADAWTARAGAAAANKHGASALFYEFQAELGFSLLKSRRQRRILFQFHPHPGWEHPLLTEDARRYPEFADLVASSTRANLSRRYAEHTCFAWKEADHVIVASSCTRTSLIHVGCPSENITVVPYGCETVENSNALRHEPKELRPYFLWVGAGSHRKGLHHLCRAWEISGCAKEASLIVVARVIDPGMAKPLNTPGVRWVQGLPRAELNWYFSHAKAFVMPSLSEGFGQVYLEALAKGCPVIGTRNSVLPDIADAQPWIDYVEPGNITELAESLSKTLRKNASISAHDKLAVAASVGSFTWESFRSGIENILRRFD